MDVTRQNFFSLLPELEKSVKKAAFIAIDGEFTGLRNGGRECDGQPFDTPEQHYNKIYQHALEFVPLQFGVCLFHYNESTKSYTHEAYTFYLFQRPYKNFLNCTFLCQPSSIDFLSNNNMDFNKVFKEGISYLTQGEEDRIRKYITDSQQKSVTRDSPDIPVPENWKSEVTKVLQKIEVFRRDLDKDDNTLEEMVVDNSTPFLRKLLYQEVPKKFGSNVSLESRRVNSDFVFVVKRGVNPEDVKKQEEEKKKKEWDEFHELIGFSHFVKAISQSGKLVVGHNCLMDFCHFVHRLRNPLPENYYEFKELVHHIFPRIIDTKIIVNEDSNLKTLIPSSVLGHIYDRLSDNPLKMVPVDIEKEGRGFDGSVDKQHDGGYDAYLTGRCFISLTHYLARMDGINVDNLGSNVWSTVSKSVEKYINRFYMFRVHDSYMQLGAPDPKPQRNHVFHVKFPSEWKGGDIIDLFKPFGQVFLNFIDDQSAFVALQDRSQARFVMTQLPESKIYKLTPYTLYQKHLKGRQSPPPYAAGKQDNLDGSAAVGEIRKRKSWERGDSPPASGFAGQKRRCSLEQRHRAAELLSFTYLLGLIYRYHLEWLQRPVRCIASNIASFIIKLLFSFAVMTSVCYVVWYTMVFGRKQLSTFLHSSLLTSTHPPPRSPKLAKRSIDPIPEEGDQETERPKSCEFEENDDWDDADSPKDN